MSQLPFPMPMTDRQAATLDARLMSLPDDFQPRRLTLSAAPTPQPEGRSDISWITTEAPDRQGDVVLAAGMDDAYFRLNPIVTLNHDYSRPPVGRSLWRKLTHDNRQTGVKAKTYYPPRPADWAQGPWLPDLAYGLLQAGLLNAKSIGFLMELYGHTVRDRPLYFQRVFGGPFQDSLVIVRDSGNAAPGVMHG